MEHQNTTNAGVLQNLAGKFEATFSSNTASGEARAPYHAQTIQSPLVRVAELLDFQSHSGRPPSHASITGDDRTIRITLKSDIVPGSYTFPNEDGAIFNVEYGELQKTGTNFYGITTKATKAELELKITADGRRYSGALNFEVLINGETLKVASSFDITLHFNNSSADQLDTFIHASDDILQNITGQFNATFPISENPGETSFSRAPYHSSTLKYDTIFLIPDINFYSQSGTSSSDTYTTSDGRSFQINLKKGITSGTYFYPHKDSPITELQYYEMRYIDNRYISWKLEILEAELKLKVFNERHYVSDSLIIKAKTATGTTLNIIANFDIYLTLD